MLHKLWRASRDTASFALSACFWRASPFKKSTARLFEERLPYAQKGGVAGERTTGKNDFPLTVKLYAAYCCQARSTP